MKKKTLFYLNQFIQNKMYDEYVNKPFITLFKEYADKELKNINDFVIIAKAYVKFIQANKEKILENSKNLTEQELKADLNEIAMVVNRLMYPENLVMRNNFIKMVEYFINKRTRVLDVGAGGVPFTSAILGRRNNNVSAMDNFILSDELLLKNNVKPINGYFDDSTDISKFDMIVGLKPCSAIGHIVSVCKRENKPYFLHLCNCGATDYGLSRFKMFSGDWKFILPRIDENVKIVNTYATNIDISKEKLGKIIYRKCKFTREMQSCGLLSFMDAFTIAMNTVSKDCEEEKVFYTDSGVVTVSKAKTSGEWKRMSDEICEEKEK